MHTHVCIENVYSRVYVTLVANVNNTWNLRVEHLIATAHSRCLFDRGKSNVRDYVTAAKKKSISPLASSAGYQGVIPSPLLDSGSVAQRREAFSLSGHFVHFRSRSEAGGEPFAISQFLLPPSFEGIEGYCMSQPLFCPFLVRQSVYISCRGIRREEDGGAGGGKRSWLGREVKGERETGEVRPSVFKAAITTV